MSLSSSAKATPSVNVWAVSFSQESFSEDLYGSGLVLLDAESQARVKRFYHKNDSYRKIRLHKLSSLPHSGCLLGRLLPYLLLKRYGIAPKDASFGRTSSGKPYVRNHLLERTIGFNISHDNEYVVMAFQVQRALVGVHAPSSDSVPQTYDRDVDVTSIGIDVMKVALPKYEKHLSSFVQSISDTLTPLERRTLLEDPESDDALRRLYLVWTLKEAYTKALGLGLGFDFKRIEVDVHACRVSIDGQAPHGWEFAAFSLESQLGHEYQIAVARLADTGHGVVHNPGHVDVRGRVDEISDSDDWFVHYDAASFIRQVAKG